MTKIFNSLLSAALIGAGWLTAIVLTQASEISFSDLPDETKSQIASYLTPYELGRFEQVSKGSQAVCASSTWTMVARPFKDDYESTDFWNKDKVVAHLLRMKIHTLPADSVEVEIDKMIRNYPALIRVPYTKYNLQLNIFFLINKIPYSYQKLIKKLGQLTNEKDNKELFESCAAERKFWELRYGGSVYAKDLDAAKELLESRAAKKEQWAIEREFLELFIDGGGVYAKDLNTIEDRLTAAKELLESSIAENNQWAIKIKYACLIGKKSIITIKNPAGYSYTLEKFDSNVSLFVQYLYDAKDPTAAARFLDKLATAGSRFAQYLYANHLVYMEQDMEKAKKYIQDYYIGF